MKKCIRGVAGLGRVEVLSTLIGARSVEGEMVLKQKVVADGGGNSQGNTRASPVFPVFLGELSLRRDALQA